MNDPLDILFENLLEHLDENLPGTCWPLYQRELRLENALLASLIPEQTELLEAYQAAAAETADPCLKELFSELAGEEEAHVWTIRGVLEQL